MSSRKRQALTQRGGTITTRGEDGWAELLREAWAAGDEEPDTLTHGFHAYPARMHPGVARVLVERLSASGDTVLDPFCGSGTVLVEAMVAGRRAYGIDLNPVAIRVAGIKCERRDASERERFGERLQGVVDASLRRVDGRVRSRAPLSPVERRFYAPHVLAELAGLYEEITAVTTRADRNALLVLLSAIVVKFSLQRADTSADLGAGKRIGKRVPTSFFARKGDELVMRWAALDQACTRASHVTAPRIVEGDMREVARLLPRLRDVDAVVSSPPYGGTYDYLEHHARRYPWLGVSPKRLRTGELGARRHLGGARGARERWDEQVGQMLAVVADVVAPHGIAALVVGDAEVENRRISADRQLERLAPGAGLQVVASAAQSRPDWRGGGPRREHIVLLRPIRDR